MAIQVYCECGNAMSVRPELGGKKVKCKSCGSVLRIPEVPLDESAEAPPPKPKAADPPRAERAAVLADSAADEPKSSDYEVVKEGEKQVTCPACGAHCAPTDSACLACGEELSGGGAPGLLSKVPRPVLFAVVGLVGFGLLALVASTLWKASRPASYTTDGLRLLKAGDHRAAQASFEKALEYDPQYGEALIGMAEAGIAGKDDRLLERYAVKAIAAVQDPGQRARLRVAYARAALEGGDYKTARNQAVDAKNEDEGLAATARGIIGVAALLAGNDDEALAELRFAASQRTEDARVYRELGLLLKKRGETVEARTNLEQCVKLAAADPPLWLTLSELRQATDDRAGAKQALQKVIELDDKNAQAHSRLSAILLAEGALDAAHQASTRACELAPDDQEARLAMGRILLALERPKAAQEELEKALKIAPSWEGEFLLGRALLGAGDAQQGVRRFQAALEKRQDDLALHLEAARLAVEKGQGAAAVTFIQRVAAKHDTSYEVHVLYARGLSAQEGRARNDKDIQAHLRRAMDLDPDRREAVALLGAYLLEKLEIEPAIEVLDRGLKRNAQDKELLFLKGRACIRAKQWDKAIEALESLKALDKTYPTAEELDQWLQRAHSGKFYGE